MRKSAVLLAVFLLSFSHPLLAGDLSAIHANALPQETAVLAAFDDAREMEPYSHVWWPEWNFPISRQDVAKRLSKDMNSLVHALKKHPENEELALVTGLVARYGYNVDVKGSPDVTLSALSQAEAIDPTDLRATWFHATFLCETLQPVEGENEFLSLEAGHPWDQLPPAFWIDYTRSIDEASILVDYGPVQIGELSYDVPIHAVAMAKSFDPFADLDAKPPPIPYSTTINNITFTDYHVFRAKSRVVTGAPGP